MNSSRCGTDKAIANDHAPGGSISIIPVPGLPRFTEGDDLCAAIASAITLADNDILVVTSKVFSKIEGRMVTTPTDPDERDALRRTLVRQEAVRVLAQRNQTLITENSLGVVQAASGIDGSNVDTDQLALLPRDPDASAQGLRAEFAERYGVSIAVIITDTMGRAWRVGQIDAAIGAAGIAVRHSYDGLTDAHGNDLMVTDIAIADELAAAADLVKGKLGEVPVAVIRGITARDDGSTARDLVRDGDDDMFRLGTDEAIALGRTQALRTRRSVRSFTDQPIADKLMHAAFADALTAPAPHHGQPIRFVWVRDAQRRIGLLDAMAQRWRSDLAADKKPADAIAKRIARGSILYTAPELVIPLLTPDGAHDYPDATRNRAENTMFTVAAGAAVQSLLVGLSTRGVGSCWVGSTIFAADIVASELDIPPSWKPMGAIAIGYPDTELTLRNVAANDDRIIIR